MSRLYLRRMHPGDLDAVCAVDRVCAAPPWSRECFASELHARHTFYRVALLDGAVVGYAGAHVVQDEAHVVTLGVHPAVRRRGIGERLLAELLSECAGRGCRRVTLEVRSGNTAALALYLKYGFEPAGCRPHYYPDNDEDALVLALEELDGPRFRGRFRELTRRLRAGAETGHLRAETRRP